MLSIWLLLAGAVQTCLCGGLYSAPISTAEAHGPLARLALDSMGASGGVHYYSGAHVPLAAAAPVDLVHHVPAVADVPVTKYVAQPGYVQKLVDVAKPKVAVAKLQVRRPAIQKQFFDIEERTVVRPVGSAVVELDEPLSKTISSPYTVIPAGYHTVAQFQQPLAYPVSSNQFLSYYPFPAQNYPAFIQQTQGVVQIPQQSFPIPQPPQRPQQPEQPRPQPPQQNPSFPQPSNPSVDDSFQNPEFDSSDTIVVENPDFSRSSIQGSERSQQNSDTEATSANSGRSQEQTGNEVNGQDSQPDQSHTIQQILDEFQQRSLLRQFLRQNDLQPVQTYQQPQPVQQFQQPENSLRQQQPEPFQRLNDLQPIQNFQQLQQFQQFQQPDNSLRQQEPQPLQRANELQPIQSFQQPQQPQQFQQPDNSLRQQQPQQLQRSQESSSEESTSQAESNTENTTQEASSTTTEAELPPLFRSSLEVSPPNRQLPTSRTYSSEGQIASVRNLSPEESQDNQQRLIELLTGRGEVSEVSFARSGVRSSAVGDSGVVRGRVLSVTPAPPSAEGKERVSTRRVVVSRPIQTLEEVDIQQPFTKLERVAVHEPALLKTAHTHIARVPASLPVVSRAVAPVLYH